jgi:iron complex transport system substrate-binding protein
MRSGLGSLVLLACLLPVAVNAWADIILTGDDGQRLRLFSSPHRIVSLAPHATELLYAAGLGDHIVGVDGATDYPASAMHVARVGGAGGYSLERMLALRPDLVVGWLSGTPPALVKRLRTRGIPVLLTEPRMLQDIPRWIRAFGVLGGNPPAAEEAAKHFTSRLDELTRRYSGLPRLRVFHLIWLRPMMTLNDDHIVSRVIEHCGGENVFSGLHLLTPAVSLEALSKQDPDVILVSGVNAEEARSMLAARLPWLRAVRNRHFISVPPELLHRAGPRLVDGAERLCREMDAVRGGRALQRVDADDR